MIIIAPVGPAHRVVEAGREHQVRVRREALEGADAVRVALDGAVAPGDAAPRQVKQAGLTRWKTEVRNPFKNNDWKWMAHFKKRCVLPLLPHPEAIRRSID